MFCKWCGKKITNIGTPCPSCGKTQDPLENGNGFWDLCSKDTNAQPTNIPAAVEVPIKDSGVEKVSKKNETSQASSQRKPVRKSWIGPWAVMVVLFVGVLIANGINVGKFDSEISDLHSRIDSLNALVADGFAQLEEYHRNEQEPSYIGQEVPEKQDPEETAPETEYSVKIDIDALIEENIRFLDDEALNVQRYEIINKPTKCIYQAFGELLEKENVKIFWQKSANQGDTWETIAEDVSSIVADVNETDTYRIIYIIVDSSGHCSLFCTAEIKCDENTKHQAHDPENNP